MNQKPVLWHIFDPAFLQSVVRQSSYQCRAEGSAMFLCDSESPSITLVASHNLKAPPWDPDLPDKIVETRRTQAVIGTDRTYVLGTPMVWQDAVGGVLMVFSKPAGTEFRDRDRALLQSLADMTASVAQQTERLARMTTQFRALHAIDVALTSSLELERVLNLILEAAAELVDAEHGSLRLLEPEAGKLVLKAHYGNGWTPEKMAYAPRIGQGIVRWVAENRRPYLSPDVRKDPLNVVLFENMRSSISVPLQFGQEEPLKPDSFMGVLLLESSRLSAFDQQDVELLEALAQEAVIAIQNANNLYRIQVEQEKRLAAEKWAVMGQAATALAHRINNLMGIVPVSAQEIFRSLSDLEIPEVEKKWIHANLGRIQRNAGFVLKLSDALFRPFKDTGPTSRYDVNRLLSEALEAADLPDRIEVTRRFAEKLPRVDSSLLLLDVFMELMINARKAMEGSNERKLIITTRCDRLDTGKWAVVEIRDTGQGIGSDRMANIWNMFHPSEDGWGFGLWWIKTFIERQGGSIDCASQRCMGTTFTLRLRGVETLNPSI